MLWLRITLATVIAVLFLSPASAHAQGSRRNGVAVSCACDDPTGQAYVHALRKALAHSQHYREVTLNENLEQSPIRINIVSVPLDPDAAGKSTRSALSIVCLDDGGILHQIIVQTCSIVPIEDSAESMLAALLKWQAASL